MDFKKEFVCDCGRVHNAGFDGYIAEAGAINRLPEVIKKYNGTKAFVLADVNTYKAAGVAVCNVLSEAGIEYAEFVFADEHLEPDERAAGAIMMHYDVSCDIVVTVGSGVLNDLGKIISQVAEKPYIVVATAPSMDGYASVTSSVVMDGVKWSIGNRCADMVIGDIDILKQAPERMLTSGLGDILAKYISIADWRIATLVTGEYYCETIADMVRTALNKCVSNCEKLLERDSEAVKDVFEGLILSGVAMNYAEVTRVASGVEHSISHIWDMRGQEFGTNTDFHGIQCGIGTLYAAKIYDKLRNYTPDVNKAREYVKQFDFEEYSKTLRTFIGSASELMIAREATDKKYSEERHERHIKNIVDNWDKIQKIIEEEVPAAKEIERILDAIKCPKTCEDIGISKAEMPITYAVTKDIRDKYVLSRFCWDLGIIDDIEF